MYRRTRVLLSAAALVGIAVTSASAQLVVTDPATTARNAVTARLKSSILEVLTEQHSKLRRMARRLSAHTNLDKYASPEPPRWRTHDFETFLYANGYHAALNYGDVSGAEYERVTRSRQSPGDLLARLTPAARDVVRRTLATLDLADSAAIAATHQTGALRYNGRRELRAIDALEAHVIDPSDDQSATAVLGKISGGVLVETRQKQARLQFLAAIVEQLLVDNKRSRDTEAAVLNMQLGRLRVGRGCGEGCVGFLTGAANDLRTWRQP